MPADAAAITRVHTYRHTVVCRPCAGARGAGGDDSEVSGGSPAAEDYIELVRDVARQRQKQHKYALLLGPVPALPSRGLQQAHGQQLPGQAQSSAEPLPVVAAR